MTEIFQQTKIDSFQLEINELGIGKRSVISNGLNGLYPEWVMNNGKCDFVKARNKGFNTYVKCSNLQYNKSVLKQNTDLN